jgi:hypothetical protein
MRYFELTEGENQFQAFPLAVHFNNWTDFESKLVEISKKGLSSEEEMCSLMGIDINLYHSVIASSINKWRDSTTTSLLHGIAHIDNNFPKPGQQIFPNVKWQTRFLLMATQTIPGFRMYVKGIPDPQKRGFFLKINNQNALTGNEEKINEVLKILFLYNFFNRSKKVKLPKIIYRGVRANDLLHNEDLKDITTAIWKSDKSYSMKHKEVLDILIQYIVDNGLDKIADGKILSFTSSIPVAKYFTRGEGFILQVDPKKVSIITSEIHDADRVGGEDNFTGKKEREYIVRIPENFAWSKDNIIINDEEYFIAEQNPLGVSLFSHDNKEASYNIDGFKVKAKFNWNSSGTNGSVRFRVNDDWVSYSRQECKKTFGFDPLPTPENLNKITEFRVHPVKKW